MSDTPLTLLDSDPCASCGRRRDAGIHDTAIECDQLRGPCLDPTSHHPFVTLDAARQPAPEAGLREAAATLNAWTVDRVFDALDRGEITPDAARDGIKALLAAALAAPAPEFIDCPRCGSGIGHDERCTLPLAAPAPDDAPPGHEDRSDCWCNPTVGWPGHPLGLVHEGPCRA